MKSLYGTILVATVAATCTATAAGNGRPEESVECPVSANMRGHENTEWSIYYGYHLTDQNRHLPRVLLVGDSICNAYQRGVVQILEGKMNVSPSSCRLNFFPPKDFSKMLSACCMRPTKFVELDSSGNSRSISMQ